MRYFRFTWDEPPLGAALANHGKVTFFLEISNLHCIRKLEIYEDGFTLAYDKEHPSDEFGCLINEPLDDLNALLPFEIGSEEFELTWAISS